MNKPYHHGDLYRVLIETACQQIALLGVEKLSLRALARSAKVSQTAPYRHFPTKLSLLAAIATEGFCGIEQATRAAVKPFPNDTRAAMQAIGVAYIDYAINNSVKYNLAFGGHIGDFSDFKELMAAGQSSFNVMLDQVKKGIERGEIYDAPLAEISAAVWAGIHGTASLIINKGVHQTSPGLPLSSPMAAMLELQQHPEHTVARLLNGLFIR